MQVHKRRRGNFRYGGMTLHAQLRQVNDDEFDVVLSTTGADGKESAFQETDYTRKK